MVNVRNWGYTLQVSGVLLGIGLIALTVLLDTFFVSNIGWIWLAVSGIGVSFTCALNMKR